MRKLFTAALLLMLGGCSANWNAIHHRETESKTTPTLSVDAKQRFLISNARTDASGKTQQVLCAEPSPDALSVLNSSLAASGSLDRVLGGSKDISAALSLALSRSESGAFVGLRTQTIQLIRDGMYRLCEAYAAGALDGHEYKKLQQRYQTITLALLAIEQLTGALAPRAASLGGQGSAGAVDGLLVLQEKLAEALKDAATATDAETKAVATTKVAKIALDEATAAVEKCKGTCAEKDAFATAQAEKDAAYKAAVAAENKAKNNAKVARDTAESIEAAVARSKGALLRVATTGTASVSPDSPAAGNQAVMTDGQSDVISARVRQITFGALLATHAFEKCFDPKDWVEAAQHPLALAEMKNMCAASIGAVAVGVTSESDSSPDSARAGVGPTTPPAAGTPPAVGAPPVTARRSADGIGRKPNVNIQGLLNKL